MPSPLPPSSTSSGHGTSTKSGHVRRRTRRPQIQRPKVLQVLRNVMEKAAATGQSASDPSHNEFFNTGRVGRRNALPDILGQHCHTSTADLPDQLSALSTSDETTASTSTTTTGTASDAGCSTSTDPSAASNAEASSKS